MLYFPNFRFSPLSRTNLWFILCVCYFQLWIHKDEETSCKAGTQMHFLRVSDFLRVLMNRAKRSLGIYHCCPLLHCHLSVWGSCQPFHAGAAQEREPNYGSTPDNTLLYVKGTEALNLAYAPLRPAPGHKTRASDSHGKILWIIPEATNWGRC